MLDRTRRARQGSGNRGAIVSPRWGERRLRRNGPPRASPSAGERGPVGVGRRRREFIAQASSLVLRWSVADPATCSKRGPLLYVAASPRLAEAALAAMRLYVAQAFMPAAREPFKPPAYLLAAADGCREAKGGKNVWQTWHGVCPIAKIQQGCILCTMSPTFSSREARSITGVSQRCLDYWDEVGVIQRSRQRGREGKRGSARVYEFDDLLQIKIVKQLRATGLSLQKIQKALKVLNRQTEEKQPLLEVLVTDGRRFEWKRADGKVEDLLRSGQLVFAGFAIGAIEADLKMRIVKLEKRSKRKQNSACAS